MKSFPIVLLLCLANHGLSLAKETYQEILTNDNELLIIESLKANLNKNSRQIAQQQQHAKSNTHVTSLSENNHTDRTKSKLIVNVVYLNTKNEKKSTHYSPATSSSASAVNSSSLSVKLVYISIDSQNPCVNHLCKPNQVCVPRPLNQTSINYDCVAAIAKESKTTHKQNVKTENKPPTAQPKLRLKTILLTKGCSMNDYTETRLAVHELFQSHSHRSSEASIETRFRRIDSNNDSRVSPVELLTHMRRELALHQPIMLINKKCVNDLILNLNKADGGRFVSLSEVRAFVDGSRPKCSVIREAADATFKAFYIKQVNVALFGETAGGNEGRSVSPRGYVPVCDTDGYFAASQCDVRVTCWCVSRLGVAIASTARRIEQNPVDCSTVV
jgi:hypothetical protein